MEFPVRGKTVLQEPPTHVRILRRYQCALLEGHYAAYQRMYDMRSGRKGDLYHRYSGP